MPATLRIDTLKFVRKLTEAGMDRRQAEAIVDGLSEADTSELATKTDIAELRLEMREMKAEIFGAMLIQAGTIVGLTVALTKLLP
jgi:ABC-type sulfate transport system substrate-binding protein